MCDVMQKRKAAIRYFEPEVMHRLEDLPNIGKEIAEDLRAIGIKTPQSLKGKDPLMLYKKICAYQGQRIDPCLLDVMMAVVAFAGGAPSNPWWFFTPERKKLYKV